MAKKTTAKKAAKKPATKRPAAKKPAPAKKAASKKAVKKVAPKKAAKAPVKKTAGKKAAPKKAAPKKAARKAAPKKAVAKKVVKSPVKKTAAKKAVKKATPKPAAKKAATPKKEVKTTTAKNVPPKSVAPKKAAPKPKAAGRSKVEKEAKAAPAPPVVRVKGMPSMPKVAPIVKKQVSTLMSADKERYSDDELDEFKEIIMKKLDEARRDYELLKQTLANTDNNGTDDTSPSFKMIEDGSETLSREETAQLAARQEKFIKHLEDALLRIRNKTYGICRVTGRLISKERLRLVPHATLSIEAKQQMNS